MRHKVARRPLGLALVVISAVVAWSPASSRAGFVSISPAGPAGPGGSITFSGIDPADSTSANVNTRFTSIGEIDVTFRVDRGGSVSLSGTAVNASGIGWVGLSASIVAGSATFRGENDPFDPFGTYSPSPGFDASIGAPATVATFRGGTVPPGGSIDTFLGINVLDPSQAVTIAFRPLTVPEPASLALVASGLVGCGVLARRARKARGGTMTMTMALCLAAWGGRAGAQGPAIAPDYAGRLSVRQVGAVPGSPAQLAFGPGGAVYASTVDAGTVRFAYDPLTGALGEGTRATSNLVNGIGVAFRGGEMYLSGLDGTLHKLVDADGDGVFGGPGELDVAIATGLPQGDHNTDQIQVVGNTLYVGVGRRTINGRLGAYTSGQLDDLGGKGFFYGGSGRTYGDSSINGVIAWIRDLDAVVDQPGSANSWGLQPYASSTLQARMQKDAGPYSTTDPGKLVVHSAGTRNPFGLCVDSVGALWFTNNYNRTATLGNGQAGFGLRGDQLDADFSKDVHDQLFRASPGADYGYFDSNWRGKNPMMAPDAPGYRLVKSTTFDNSYNQGPYALHDPARPDGLGPHSSADGCAFAYHPNLPGDLRGNVFIARFNGTVTEAPGGAQRSLTYGDVVAVDPASGRVARVASGFSGPLAVLADDRAGRLLVATLNDRKVFAIDYLGP